MREILMNSDNHTNDDAVESQMEEFDPYYKPDDKRRYLLWSSFMLLIMIMTALITVLLEKKSIFSYMPNERKQIDTTVPRQKLTNISYDDHALTIDGKRQLLIVGAIHYPRSSPGMWAHLLKQAKEAGINTIDTYVFWNLHEPQEGKFDFDDLLKFLKTAKDEDLWVNLRIGPYVCAEWNFGGFPYWIRDISGLTVRTWNQPFMDKMEIFVRKTVNAIDAFLASKGGNIIMMQIENEYDNVIKSYGEDGKRYISWAADLANSLDTGVPWIMCLSEGIKTVITTCNGFYCDNWIGQHSVSIKQPAMFTELWSGWFQQWGDAKPIRTSQDLAFSIARFIIKGGTYVSYYMWHGGTNFGRNGGEYQTTSYDYDAPVNEYGFPSQPKYDHLAKLHFVLRKYEQLLLNSKPKYLYPGWGKEVHIYGDTDDSSEALVVFSNYRDKNSATFKFGQKSYIVPKWTVEFYDKKKGGNDLKLLFSTSDVVVVPSKSPRKDPKETDLRYKFEDAELIMQWIPENIGIWDNSSSKIDVLQEQLSITKDKTDYLWYSLSNINLEINNPQPIFVNIKSVTDVWYIWVDDIPMFPSAISIPTSLDETREISAFLPSSMLSSSVNQSHNITILSVVMGLKNYGPWYDSVKKGLFDSLIYLNGKELGKNDWNHQAGIQGEQLQYYNQDVDHGWKTQELPVYASLIWYKIYIPSIKIKDLLLKANIDQSQKPFVSFALNMSKMGKGNIWVNGHSIGRYWDITPNNNCKSCNYAGGFYDHKCLTNCGEPSQSYYHIPYEWLVKFNGQELQDATIVVFEEKGGNPNEIELVMLL